MTALVGVGVGAALLAGLPVMVMAAAAPPPEQVCVPSFTADGAATSVASGVTATGLDETQLQHAATITRSGGIAASPIGASWWHWPQCCRSLGCGSTPTMDSVQI